MARWQGIERAVARDSVAITVAVLLSLVWYAPQLGFCSDDWAFLARYATSPDQTVAGLYAASHSSQHAPRPVQLWLCAVLYWLFGLNPAGHQLTTALLLVANALLVFATASASRVPRPIAVAIALVYGTLPSYSTDRYWYVAIAITFSMTTCLVSLYADIKAMTLPVRTGAWWKLLSAAALVVSVLAYEVAMPLLLVAPWLFAWHLHRRHSGHPRRRVLYVATLLAINLVLLAGLSAFKLRTTVRLGAQQGIVAQVADIARQSVRLDVARNAYGLNLANAARVHVRDYGVLLPLTALRLAKTATAVVVVLTVLVGIGTFAYFAFGFAGERLPEPAAWTRTLVSGIVVSGLGYAIFLTNYNVQFTATGIANRTAIVAALGAAMCMTGVLGLLASILPRLRARTLAFASLLAVYTASGVLSVNAIAGYWIEAYGVERKVLASIRERLPTMPPESALILDGVCPYVGPAIVFEADWDLAGALQVMYRDPTLAANVVTPRMRIEADALSFTLYNEPTRYPYSSRLFVYEVRTDSVRPIPDHGTAQAYFAKSRGAWSCPPGHEGIGVEVF